ncbi:MAG: NUDIX domain-containing protein [Candidatus Marinimicrobia bacterium]|nr:NUDIX domain-containing protein [Candidatus Neomarinimicrobiota bacterium]
MKKAVGIALVKGDSILFQLRDDKTTIMPKHWGLPCGEVEKDETLKQAITREFQEETGYQLKNPLLYATDTYLENGRKVKNHLYYERYDGKQEIKCLEGEKMEFITIRDLKRKKVIPRHDKYAQKAIETIR